MRAVTTPTNAPDGLDEFTELIRDEQDYSGLADVDVHGRRRRRRRGLLITAIVLVLILGATGGYVGWALTAPVSAPELTSSAPAAPVAEAAALALPPEGASAIAVAGADEYLGPSASGIWATSGTDEPRSIASISKLITAMVILQARPLAGPDDPGPVITFDKAAHDLYDKYYVMGATIVPMPTGLKMTLRDALATMLVPSASNYAEAVSTWAFGSQGAFVGAARRWLADHGLNGTTIVEPTGISPRNTSTLTDLMAIGKLAAADPVISALAAMPSVEVPEMGVVPSTNNLLGSGGITGLKTGNLGPGSYNLLYTASLDAGTGRPLSVTGVMLGGGSREAVDRYVLNLLDSVRAGFRDVPVAEQGQQVGSYATAWGATARVVVARDTSIFTWSDTPITVSMTTDTPSTYTDGEVVGTITWTAGPNSASVDLELDGTIEPPTEWWRLTHPSELAGR